MELHCKTHGRQRPRRALLLAILVIACDLALTLAVVRAEDTLALVAQAGNVGIVSDPPDVTKPYIKGVYVTGKGCPEGSYDYYYLDAYKKFFVQFTKFEIQVSPDVPKYVVNLDCLINVELAAPQGIEVAVATFAYRGDVYLESGVTAQAGVRYFFAGLPFDVKRDQDSQAKNPLFTGPVDREFVFNDHVSVDLLQWSGCSPEKVLQVRASLHIKNASPKRIGLMKMRTVNGNVALRDDVGEFAVSFASRKCAAEQP